MDELHQRRASVFGSLADDYDRLRPGYPDEAVDWLLPPGARRVLDLGAGTGKLTDSLVARGLEVVAVEPDADMLAVLQRHHPDVETHCAGAELIPLPDQSADAIVVGQAWHWFDPIRALAEARRLLRPGGWLGLIWNAPFAVDQWQRDVVALEPQVAPMDGEDVLDTDRLPGLPDVEIESIVFDWTWEITPQHLAALHATHSIYAILTPAERDPLLAAIERLATAEAARHGSATVAYHHHVDCVRVR